MPPKSKNKGSDSSDSSQPSTRPSGVLTRSSARKRAHDSPPHDSSSNNTSIKLSESVISDAAQLLKQLKSKPIAGLFQAQDSTIIPGNAAGISENKVITSITVTHSETPVDTGNILSASTETTPIILPVFSLPSGTRFPDPFDLAKRQNRVLSGDTHPLSNHISNLASTSIAAARLTATSSNAATIIQQTTTNIQQNQHTDTISVLIDQANDDNDNNNSVNHNNRRTTGPIITLLDDPHTVDDKDNDTNHTLLGDDYNGNDDDDDDADDHDVSQRDDNCDEEKKQYSDREMDDNDVDDTNYTYDYINNNNGIDIYKNRNGDRIYTDSSDENKEVQPTRRTKKRTFIVPKKSLVSQRNDNVKTQDKYHHKKTMKKEGGDSSNDDRRVDDTTTTTTTTTTSSTLSSQLSSTTVKDKKNKGKDKNKKAKKDKKNKNKIDEKVAHSKDSDSSSGILNVNSSNNTTNKYRNPYESELYSSDDDEINNISTLARNMGRSDGHKVFGVVDDDEDDDNINMVIPTSTLQSGGPLTPPRKTTDMSEHEHISCLVVTPSIHITPHDNMLYVDNRPIKKVSPIRVTSLYNTNTQDDYINHNPYLLKSKEVSTENILTMPRRNRHSRYRGRYTPNEIETIAPYVDAAIPDLTSPIRYRKSDVVYPFMRKTALASTTKKYTREKERELRRQKQIEEERQEIAMVRKKIKKAKRTGENVVIKVKTPINRPSRPSSARQSSASRKSPGLTPSRKHYQSSQEDSQHDYSSQKSKKRRRVSIDNGSTVMDSIYDDNNDINNNSVTNMDDLSWIASEDPVLPIIDHTFEKDTIDHHNHPQVHTIERPPISPPRSLFDRDDRISASHRNSSSTFDSVGGDSGMLSPLDLAADISFSFNDNPDPGSLKKNKRTNEQHRREASPHSSSKVSPRNHRKRPSIHNQTSESEEMEELSQQQQIDHQRSHILHSLLDDDISEEYGGSSQSSEYDDNHSHQSYHPSPLHSQHHHRTRPSPFVPSSSSSSHFELPPSRLDYESESAMNDSMMLYKQYIEEKQRRINASYEQTHKYHHRNYNTNDHTNQYPSRPSQINQHHDTSRVYENHRQSSDDHSRIYPHSYDTSYINRNDSIKTTQEERYTPPYLHDSAPYHAHNNPSSLPPPAKRVRIGDTSYMRTPQTNIPMHSMDTSAEPTVISNHSRVQSTTTTTTAPGPQPSEKPLPLPPSPSLPSLPRQNITSTIPSHHNHHNFHCSKCGSQYWIHPPISNNPNYMLCKDCTAPSISSHNSTMGSNIPLNTSFQSSIAPQPQPIPQSIVINTSTPVPTPTSSSATAAAQPSAPSISIAPSYPSNLPPPPPSSSLSSSLLSSLNISREELGAMVENYITERNKVLSSTAADTYAMGNQTIPNDSYYPPSSLYTPLKPVYTGLDSYGRRNTTVLGLGEEYNMGNTTTYDPAGDNLNDYIQPIRQPYRSSYQPSYRLDTSSGSSASMGYHQPFYDRHNRTYPTYTARNSSTMDRYRANTSDHNVQYRQYQQQQTTTTTTTPRDRSRPRYTQERLYDTSERADSTTTTQYPSRYGDYISSSNGGGRNSSSNTTAASGNARGASTTRRSYPSSSSSLSTLEGGDSGGNIRDDRDTSTNDIYHESEWSPHRHDYPERSSYSSIPSSSSSTRLNRDKGPLHYTDETTVTKEHYYTNSRNNTPRRRHVHNHHGEIAL